jgi:hypothetical protein
VCKQASMRTASSMSAVVLVAAIVGCPSPRSPTDAGTAVVAAANPQASSARKRPPYPNMATAAWGQEVLEERLRAVPAAEAAPPKTTDILDALHELAPGSELRAQELAVRAFRGAKTDAERGTAAALLAAALVLEPTAQGYKDRVTDAFGIGAYAGTLDASDAVGQGARALVNASAGSLAQAERLVDVVANTPRVTAEARLFLALTRRVTGSSPLDVVIADLKQTLEARPKSLRARTSLAEILLDLGFSEDVIFAVDAPDTKDTAGVRAPWLVALHGRALVLQGEVPAGIELLRDAESKLEEGRRGDALYWLGRSLTQTEAWATEVPPIAAQLQQREGFMKEARTLEALVALLGGDPKKAADIARPLAMGQARMPVDIDAGWIAVDACAGAHDEDCVEELGRKVVTLDGDLARLFRARATAHAKPEAGPDEKSLALNTQAERLSPFADDPVATRRLKAARKAVVRGAPSLARAALAPHAKKCRVCAAVLTHAQGGKDGAEAALAALAIPEGISPPLADADLVGVIDALGGHADDRTRAALEALAKDSRPMVQKAVAQARADHKDPDARRRREAGAGGDAHGHDAPHGPGSPPLGHGGLPLKPSPKAPEKAPEQPVKTQ